MQIKLNFISFDLSPIKDHLTDFYTNNNGVKIKFLKVKEKKSL